MIKYPLIGYTAGSDGFYLDNVGTTSQKEITENKKKFIEWMKDITLLKVNIKNNTVKIYKKGDFSVSTKFISKEENGEWGEWT